MKIKIGDEQHIVVYIDYNDGDIPHQVHTIKYIEKAEKPYWRLYDWDFFANNGDKTDLRAYDSGSGGSHKAIQAPQWADGHIGKYWIHKDAKFKGKVKNGKQLKYPISLPAYYTQNIKKSRNPFKCAEITNDCEYCEMCGHESTEWCQEHKYCDSKGNERYKHNRKLV
jgi:hypothetical protein